MHHVSRQTLSTNGLWTMMLRAREALCKRYSSKLPKKAPPIGGIPTDVTHLHDGFDARPRQSLHNTE